VIKVDPKICAYLVSPKGGSIKEGTHFIYYLASLFCPLLITRYTFLLIMGLCLFLLIINTDTIKNCSLVYSVQELELLSGMQAKGCLAFTPYLE
jgi:hypothetical protein